MCHVCEWTFLTRDELKAHWRSVVGNGCFKFLALIGELEDKLFTDGDMF